MTRSFARCALACLLCVLIMPFAHAEIPAVDLTVLSRTDLTQINKDISAERALHHEVSASIREMTLSAVKSMTEDYYAKQGMSISWAWYDSEYKYTRNMDLLTLNTHLDYKDADKKNHQVSVNAELYYDGASCTVYCLALDRALVYLTDYTPPEDHWIVREEMTINQKTGVNLSLLSADDLKQWETAVKKELDVNHDPKNTSKVNNALTKAVESYLSGFGVSSVSWPWFDYDYTCDWDCYTEKTRITYDQDGTRHRDVPVYAEIFGVDGSYHVAYLKLGDEVIFDKMDQFSASNVLLFLNSRRYEHALQLLADGDYDQASEIFLSLGSFDDSAAMASRAMEAKAAVVYQEAAALQEAGEYEQAAAIFESLGDYADSSSRMASSRSSVQALAYEDAVVLQEAGEYAQAIAAFQALGDYADAGERIEACRLAERDLRYQAAVTLMNEGEYESAQAVFVELSDFLDSTAKAEECRTAILDRDYQKALAVMASGKFEEAISLFEALDGYSQSQEMAETCREAIRQQDYQAALSLYAEGKYEEALSTFQKLGDYSDSPIYAGEIPEIMATINRKIIFESEEIHLFQGKNMKLTPSVTALSSEAPEKTNLVYSTSDHNTVRVAKDGTISGSQVGDAVIYCSAADNERIVSTVTVHVVKSVNRVTLDSNRLNLSLPEMNGNSKARLSWSFDPEDAFVRTGTWTSNNEAVATVDQDGSVQAQGIGHAVLTFTADDDSRGKKAITCNVNVVQAVTSVELAETSGDVYVGKVTQLKATVLPQNAANKKITWTSSDESVATVTANGQVKGVTVGKATITATSADGPSVSFQANVKIAPVRLKISYNAKCIAKNHVGNSWSKEYYLNGEEVRGTAQIDVENGDVITVGVEITENDTYPDWEYFRQNVEITPEIMTKGTKIEETVYVTENSGRYSGYSAEWRVTITIRP